MKLLKCVLLMICLFKKGAGKVLSSDLDKVNEIDCMNQVKLVLSLYTKPLVNMLNHLKVLLIQFCHLIEIEDDSIEVNDRNMVFKFKL